MTGDDDAAKEVPNKAGGETFTMNIIDEVRNTGSKSVNLRFEAEAPCNINYG